MSIGDFIAVTMAVRCVLEMGSLPEDVKSIEDLAEQYVRTEDVTLEGIREALDTPMRKMLPG